MSLYGNKFKELVCLIVRDWQDQKLVGWPACWRHRKSWCCSWSLKVSGGKILSSSGDLAVFLFILQQVEWGPPTASLKVYWLNSNHIFKKNTFIARSGLVFVTGYRDLAAYIHRHPVLSRAFPALLHCVNRTSCLCIPQPDVLLPRGLCTCCPLCLDLFPNIDAEHGSVLCFLHILFAHPWAHLHPYPHHSYPLHLWPHIGCIWFMHLSPVFQTRMSAPRGPGFGFVHYCVPNTQNRA